MKIYVSLIVLTSLTSAFVGCSGHTSAAYPKNNDSAVIKVADGKRGDLSSYLDWTEGTPVIIHLAITNASGKIIDAGTVKGSLDLVTRNFICFRDASGNTSGFDKNVVSWVEKDTRK
jgi:hypothetical protein